MNQGIMDRIISEARELKLLGKYSEAKALRITLKKLQEESNIDPAERSSNLNQIAHLAANNGELLEAICAAEECLLTYQNSKNIQNETLATYFMMLACLLAESGRFVEAVQYGENALSLYTQNHGSQNDFYIRRANDVESMRKGEVRKYLDIK